MDMALPQLDNAGNVQFIALNATLKTSQIVFHALQDYTLAMENVTLVHLIASHAHRQPAQNAVMVIPSTEIAYALFNVNYHV